MPLLILDRPSEPWYPRPLQPTRRPQFDISSSG
ncbi:unnamed protein product [Coffea canephora]|uniref:Uncharacterized protein n=1 Tax=Coffea canephora TaxID=49390 RepID=A0A068VH40_COFCA|nr:unnamed protein product [Coffea canephora]